jgi:PAS domain S-box-containing protein
MVEGDTQTPALAFLAGGGEMGALIRTFDWSATPLGPPESWPPSLRAMARMALTTRHPVFIFWGPSRTCLYNDAYSRSLGPEKHPGILGMPAREAWSETWDTIHPQIEYVFAGKGSTWHENQLVPMTRHGELQDVYWTYSYGPIDDEGAPGGIGGVLVMCTETTEQVLAEDRAKAERARFAAMFEQAPSFMALLSGPDHRIELANPAYLRLIRERSVVGRTVAEALPDAVAQGYVATLDQVYRKGRAVTATGARYVVQRDPDGPADERYVDFVFQPITDTSGAVTGIFVDGVDVTERARIDESLRHSEEQLRLATDAAEVGSWDVDLLTDTLHWPARTKAMFGISADVPVTMADFYGGLHPEDAERTAAAYAAAADPELRALYDVEYRTIGKEDGVIRWVAAKGRGRFDDHGQCVRVIGTAIDITARKATEAKLKELNETLESQVRERTEALMAAEEQLRQAQKMEAVGQLTGGIAHDFNNLLQGLLGSLDLIRRRPDDGARVRRWAEAGLQSAERGAKLTSQLLAFSRAQKLDTRPVAVGELVAGMAHLLGRTLGPNVKVRLDLQATGVAALCDPTQLEMSVLNLAINARDAMAGRGELLIATRPRTLSDDPELPAGDYVELMVGDNGPGMPPEVAARAFDPFFTTKGVGQGTGLGLSQVYASAKQAGGAARIETTPGRGTTVRLLLRRVDVDFAPLGEAAAGLEETSALAAKILVVDDDAEVRGFLLDSLESLGFQALEAEDGYAGLAALDRSAPDLMILDFAMPGMNGAEVAQAALAKRPDLPIVFASGYADTQSITDVVGDEALILRKPFRIDELQGVLAQALPRVDAG